jgi:hypothetical protein
VFHGTKTAQSGHLSIEKGDIQPGKVARAKTLEAIGQAMEEVLTGSTAGFLDIRCRRVARCDLGRPTRTPAENKEDFMRFLAMHS